MYFFHLKTNVFEQVSNLLQGNHSSSKLLKALETTHKIHYFPSRNPRFICSVYNLRKKKPERMRVASRGDYFRFGLVFVLKNKLNWNQSVWTGFGFFLKKIWLGFFQFGLVFWFWLGFSVWLGFFLVWLVFSGFFGFRLIKLKPNRLVFLKF